MAIVTLEEVNNNILSLHREISELKHDIEELRDTEVRPEYLAKLDHIEKGKFLSQEEFDKIMQE